jgi:hypothetical protein
MTKQELKAKIDKLENGIKSKATPSNLIAPLKAQKAKLEKELQDMEAAEKKAVKTKKVSKVAEKIKAAKTSVAKKTPAKAPAKEERKKDNIVRDGDRKSLPAGKRISKTGKVYYEMRANRTDKQTSVKPYLADGGKIEDKFKGKNSKEIWNDLDSSTRAKVLEYLYLKGNSSGVQYYDSYNSLNEHSFSEWDKLPKNIKKEIENFGQKNKMADGGELTEKKLLVLKADDEKGGNVFVSEEVVKVKDLDDAKSKVKEFVAKYNLDDKTFTGGRYFKLVKTSKKTGNVTSSDVKSVDLGTIDSKGNFKLRSSKMADGGEINFGEDLGGGFSIGNDVYITDSKSLFQGKTGFVSGSVGRDLLVTIMDNGNERSVVVSKKGVEKLDAPEYAHGGYVIFEGRDNYNDKPLYKVISKDEDNDYDGEFHDNREDAEKELKELKNKDMNYGYGGKTKSRKSMKDLTIEQISSMTGVGKVGVERFSDENNLSEDDLSNIMQGLGRRMISASDFATAVSGNKDNQYTKEIVDFAKSGKGYKMADGGEMYARQSIKGFYVDTYPTDELGQEINDEASFEGLNKVLDCNIDVYEYLGVGDSLVRERVFAKLAELMGVSYNVIMDKWSSSDYADGGYMADGGMMDVVNAEISTIRKNIMGTTSFMMKIKGMRNPQDFSVYPISTDQSGQPIKIQSATRFGFLDLSSGRGLMSQSHPNGAYSYHFTADKKVPFKLSGTDLQRIKEHISGTAGSSVGNMGISSDNSGASMMALGGYMADGGETEEELYKVVGKKNGQLVDVSELPMSKDDANKFIKEQGIENYYKNVDVIRYRGNKPRHKMAHGGEVPAHFGSGKNIDVFGYQTEHFDICGTAVKEFESAMEIMQNGKESEKESLARCAKYVDGLFGIEKQVVENSGADDANFYEAVSDIMSASIYNYRAEMSINLFSFVPQHLKEIAVRMAKAEKGGLYALGGMTAGRWYRDKSGEEFKFIGKIDSGENKGKFLFNDGQKSVYKDLEDFEGGKPKETKLFGFFEHGGSVAEGNYEMLMSNIKAIKHHAEELADAVKPDTEIEAWVLSKSERAETDLSDITHYLDGLKMEKGGTLEMEEFYLYDENGKKYEFYKKEGDNYMFSSYKVPFGKALTIEKSELQEKIKDGKYKVVASHAKGGDLSSIKKKYEENEDENAHSENVVLLAKHFGTKEDLAKAKEILALHEKEGSLSSENGKKRQELHLKLIDKARAEMGKQGIEFEKGGYMAKGGEIAFDNSNLYLNGFGMDSNGNSVVKVSFPNQRAFSIQTNGVLKETNSLYTKKIGDLSEAQIKTIEKEVVDYVKQFGSKEQKQRLKTYSGYMAKGGEFKPYGKTKGKYKIEYTEDGEKQSEVWESKEMVEDRGKRLLKLGHTNIKITELKQMAKGGIYSSDSLYILKVSKDGKEVGEERFRAKNIREAKEMGEDYEEKYKTKFGGDLSFSVKEAMASGGKVKFSDKVKSVQESLLKRKKVSPKVQKDYGKTYSKAEAKESAQRIVGSRMAQLKEKMAKKKK